MITIKIGKGKPANLPLAVTLAVCLTAQQCVLLSALAANPSGKGAAVTAKSKPAGAKGTLPTRSTQNQSAAPSKVQQALANFKGDKWAVVIGVSRFSDGSIPQLKYSAKDAQDFYDYLTDPNHGHFAKDHVKLLLNEDASKVNIMDVIGDSFLPHGAAPGDLVVIYLSTHGSPAGADIRGVNYVIASDSRVNKLFATGIEMRQLLRTVKERVHTNRVVLVLDTCYSGAGTEGSHKGIFRRNVDTEALASSSGSVVISSSSADQQSWEADEVKNSYFTKYLLESLRDPSVGNDLERAFNSMKDRVQSAVLRDKGAVQTPVMGGAVNAKGLALGAMPAVNRQAPVVAFAAPETGSTSGLTDGSRGGAAVDLSDYGQRMRNAYNFRNARKSWDAIHELQAAQKINPSSIEAFMQATDILDEQGRYAEALESAKKAVLNSENSSEAHFRLGRANLRMGNKDEALRQVRLALSLDPGNAMAYNWLGFINQNDLQRIDEAEQNYRKALELDPLNARAMVNLGLLLQNDPKKTDEAEKLFKRALEADSEDWQARMSLGYLLFYLKGNKVAGTKELRKAIELDPANSRLHSELAEMLSDNPEELHASEGEFRKGIELSPKSGLAHFKLAEFLALKTNRVEEAEKEYREAIQLDPSLDSARVGYAYLLIDQKHIYDKSYDQLKEAIKINQRNAKAYLGLGRIQMELYKNYPAAEAEIKKALAINPNYAEAYDVYGVLLSTRMNRHSEAKSAFEKSVAADPKASQPLYHYAQMLIAQGKDIEQANKLLRAAIDLNPKESSYKTALAYIQISHYKQFKSAEQLLRQALEANLSDSQAHFRLGMLLIEKLGLRKEGESELKTALTQDPENREIKTAVERFAR